MVQAHLLLKKIGAGTEYSGLVQELNLYILVQELKTRLPKSPLRAQAPGKEQTAERSSFKELKDEDDTKT